VFHLDVLKVDLGEAHAADASAPPWVTCRHGSLRTPAGATAATCMRACETEWARGGLRACVVPHGLWSRMGAGTRELDVSSASVGAPSNASASDRTSASKSKNGLILQSKHSKKELAIGGGCADK
jgi:hypothetical protein